MTSVLETRIRHHIRALDEAQLRRRLRAPAGIDLSSNDYLGLAGHPLVRQRMAEAVLDEGAGSTGSRLLRGHRAAFEEVEDEFARFKGTERALYFSSGYLANLGVLTAFTAPRDVILADRLNHASLRDGARLSPARVVMYRHNDLRDLTRLLKANRGPGQTFVVTESLFSMDGDTPPLAEYAAVCRRTGAMLVVDEAHAVGIYGARGSGLVEEAGIAGDVFVSVNTAGKALGVAGAFVAGPAWAIEYLVQRARPFIFSTAPPPAVAAGIQASLSIVSREPELRALLRARIARLRARLGEAGVAIPHGDSPIVPVVIGDNARTWAVAQALQAEGFDVRAIRPPTVPQGTARLRISVNTTLTEASIDRFAEVLAAALEIPVPCHAGSS